METMIVWTRKHTKFSIGALWLVERVLWTAGMENAHGELTIRIVHQQDKVEG